MWLRLYTDIAHKAKTASLPPVLFKHWVLLLCLAKEYDGRIPSSDEAAFTLRIAPKAAERVLQELAKRKLFTEENGGWIPKDWLEHQYVSDDQTEKSRRYRNRKKQANSSDTHPPMQPSETGAGNQIAPVHAPTNAPTLHPPQSRAEQSRAETTNVIPPDEGSPVKQPAAVVPFVAPGKKFEKTKLPEVSKYSTESISYVRNMLQSYMGGNTDPPDDDIVTQVLDAAHGASPQLIAEYLKTLHKRGQQPGRSGGPKGYAWFPSVVGRYFSQAKGKSS